MQLEVNLGQYLPIQTNTYWNIQNIPKTDIGSCSWELNASQYSAIETTPGDGTASRAKPVSREPSKTF